MNIYTKKILLIIHDNIKKDIKKYVLTEHGMCLIDEIASFVKRNFDDYVIYSSSELINLLTAKSIFQKTRILTKVEKRLDNNKNVFNDKQLSINFLNNIIFIDKNSKTSIKVKENENLIETFLRVKKIFKHILLQEKEKNLIFIVCDYIGECIINCMNEYKKYDYNDDLYIYSIKYKTERINKKNYRVNILDSELLKSANIHKKTFFKLKKKKKIVRKINLFDCCYLQYVDSDYDEDYIINKTTNTDDSEICDKNYDNSYTYEHTIENESFKDDSSSVNNIKSGENINVSIIDNEEEKKEQGENYLLKTYGTETSNIEIKETKEIEFNEEDIANIEEENILNNDNEKKNENENLFLKIKNLCLESEDNDNLSINEIIYCLHLKGYSLTKEEISYLSTKKINKNNCLDELKKLIEYFKERKENYENEFNSFFKYIDADNSSMPKDILEFFLLNYGDRLEKKECEEFFEAAKVNGKVDCKSLLNKLINTDFPNIGDIFVNESL